MKSESIISQSARLVLRKIIGQQKEITDFNNKSEDLNDKMNSKNSENMKNLNDS